MKELHSDIIRKVMAYARGDAKNCGRNCYDFRLKRSSVTPNVIYVRYTRVDVSNPNDPQTSFRWICFDKKGEMTMCDPKFKDAKIENMLKSTMETVITSEFAEEYV